VRHCLQRLPLGVIVFYQPCVASSAHLAYLSLRHVLRIYNCRVGTRGLCASANETMYIGSLVSVVLRTLGASSHAMGS